MTPLALGLLAVLAAPADDRVDLVFPGPAVVRLDIQVAGQPCRAAWDAYLLRLFSDLDRNADGKLDPAEAARVPAPGFLRLLLQGDTETETGAPVPPLAALDQDRDQRITPGELAAFYARAGLGAIVPVIRAANGDPVTEALFRTLDANGDGRLSRAELDRAAAVLHRLDLNEDEWWTPAEIAPRGQARPQSAPSGTADVKVGPAAAPGADREVVIRLGRREAGEALVSAASLSLGQVTLTITAADRPENPFASVRLFYLQEFQAADADGGGRVERRQLGDADFLRSAFVLADRDCDGQLTGKELNQFLDLHAAGAAALVTVTVADQSQGLFALLDANADGRLSLRELNGAGERLRTFDRDGDGQLARAELPHQYDLRLTQGYARPRRRDARPAEAAPLRRGPAWFQAMDRNGDGDVSPREFLGDQATFRRLDRDGDGLLSAAEAEKASD